MEYYHKLMISVLNLFNYDSFFAAAEHFYGKVNCVALHLLGGTYFRAQFFELASKKEREEKPLNSGGGGYFIRVPQYYMMCAPLMCCNRCF